MAKAKCSGSGARRVLRAFAGNRPACACLAVLALLVATAVVSAFLPIDPDAVDVLNKLAGPSAAHPLGTDNMGRDTLARALYGGRVSLAVGACAMLVSVVVGTLLGTVSGYAGGAVDVVCMRLVDVLMSVPSLLIIIVAYAFLPRSTVTLVFMLAFFTWASVARVVRAQTLSLKEREYVAAARAMGASHAWIVVRHILPGLMPQVTVAASLSIANAILDESALSFLGYGVQLPTASWGSMLQTAQQYILYSPLMAAVPGVLILVTVLCFNVVGDALQKAFDPKQSAR